MKMINKPQFVALLDGAGVTDEQKTRFHALFEQRHPEFHEVFLLGLGIAPDEVARIRAGSKKG